MNQDLTARKEKVLTEVAQIIREVMGTDAEISGEIGMKTMFSADLELESVEFVVLAEKVQQKYGTRNNLIQWFSGKELDEMINLTVGDLVSFIVESESSP